MGVADLVVKHPLFPHQRGSLHLVISAYSIASFSFSFLLFPLSGTDLKMGDSGSLIQQVGPGEGEEDSPSTCKIMELLCLHCSFFEMFFTYFLFLFNVNNPISDFCALKELP